MNNNVYYFCFYVNDRLKDQLSYIPTSSPKMQYIIDKIKFIGKHITIVSCANTKKGFFRSRMITVDDAQKEVYFSTFRSEHPVISKLNAMIKYLQLVMFSLIKLHRNDIVVVYHSLYFSLLVYVLKMKGVCLIEEVEEIYADVLEEIGLQAEKVSRVRIKEYKTLAKADKYICVSEALAEMVTGGKPYCVLMGAYVANKSLYIQQADDQNHIHLVYSGTFSKGKGCSRAIESAYYLDNRYVLHISGFGTEEEVCWIKEYAKKHNEQNRCQIIFHGQLQQQDNNELLQRCQIGFCTQDLSAKFNQTSFPSKILNYLGNGLRVVATRMSVLENSELSDHMYYYDEDTPESVAEAVKQIDLLQPYDSRAVLRELDEKFVNEIGELLCD